MATEYTYMCTVTKDAQENVHYTVISPIEFYINPFILDTVMANHIHFPNYTEERGGFLSISENQPRTGLKCNMASEVETNQ